ncbi:MAG: hypothetical protein ACRYFS_24345 [Janthinobacterium lividum]
MNAATGKVNPNAFYMRERDFDGPPPHGLSAIVLNHCPTIIEIKEVTGLKSNVCGVDVLTVGAVREVGLEVVRTSETKSLIVGMPYPENDEDYAAAEKRNILANKLVAISRPGTR